MHPEFPPVAFISAFSLLLPLPWHWRARNIATLSIIGWLFVSNIIYGVDAIIWAGSIKITALVWCDISTKIIIGANFALPAACLCVAMHLEQVSSLRLARTTIADKRRRQYFEAFMCIGIPFLFMILHIIVQGHRFDIIEDYGCRPTTYFSIPAIFIIWVFPMVMSLGALIFSALALRHFIHRRLSFASHLNASNPSLTTSRYFRLMLMAVLQMFWSIGSTIYALWFTVTALPMRPWTTWADVHSDFLRVDAFASLFTPPFMLKTYYILWWLVPASTVLFVAFFSFGQDAMDEYRKCFIWFKTHVLRLPVISKDRNGFKGFKGFTLSSGRKGNGIIPIASPTLISSSNGGISAKRVSLSSILPPSPSSIKKSESFFRDSEYDTASESSQYPSPAPFAYSQYKAIGSASALVSPLPPSTAMPPYATNISINPLPLTPPSPLSPPPSHFASRADQADPNLPISPRPYTFPSDDPLHKDIDPSELRKPL